MRIAALITGLAALASLGAGLWLMLVTADFFAGPDYAPGAAGMPGYSAGPVDADGSGIFIPAGLLCAVGLFLGRFAFNLWRNR